MQEGLHHLSDGLHAHAHLPKNAEEAELEEAQQNQARETLSILETVARGLGAEPHIVLMYVKRMQRIYRTSVYVYRHFGPALFIDSTGESSHGRVDFLDGSLKPPPWIRITQTSSPARLVKLLDYYWELPRPEVLITVTGGAQDFSLSPQLQAAFDRGLVTAATSAKAWVISAGSDTGVMKLVGEAIAKQEATLPLIGIFPWGVTNARDRLQNSVGQAASYGQGTPASRDGAPLNRHHTHFLLVDNGTEGAAAWGSEIDLRTKLEATISNTKGVPIVQLVVQGGPGTLATVESIALEGKPIVILTNSGGAATAIYDYCQFGLSAVEAKFQKMEPRLASIKLLNEIYGEQLLSFYTLDDSSLTPDLSTLLLGAIVKTMNTEPAFERIPAGAAIKHPSYGRGRVTKVFEDGRRAVAFQDDGAERVFSSPGASGVSDSSRQLSDADGHETWQKTDSGETSGFDMLLSKALNLTIVWDQPELALKILGALKKRISVDDGEVGSRPEVAASFQRALELQRKRVTQMFVTLPGLDISRVSMGRLFRQPDDAHFLTKNRALQLKLHQFISKSPYVTELRTAGAQLQSYQNFQRASTRFYMSLSPVLAQLLRSQNCTPACPARPRPPLRLPPVCTRNA